MTRVVVRVDARFVVDADTPQEALAFLNSTDPAINAFSVGHTQWVHPIGADDARHLNVTRNRDEATYDHADGDWPLLSLWSPAAWPARTCASRGPLLERRNGHVVARP